MVFCLQVETVEQFLEEQLHQRMPSFNMTEFQKQLTLVFKNFCPWTAYYFNISTQYSCVSVCKDNKKSVYLQKKPLSTYQQFTIKPVILAALKVGNFIYKIILAPFTLANSNHTIQTQHTISTRKHRQSNRHADPRRQQQHTAVAAHSTHH